MRRKKGRFLILAFMLVTFCAAFMLCGCFENAANEELKAPTATDEFSFTALKVGQADAFVLTTKEDCIIIDCGEKDDGEKICEFLKEKGISKIDYLFVTHFDKDHVGGFPKVIENFQAEQIMVPDYEGSNKEYKNYVETKTEKNLNVAVLKEDFSFVSGDVLFEVSVPKKKLYEESDNDFSIVVSATHGTNRFLFTGDAEEARLSEIKKEFRGGYDFLKVPHHGRFNKMTKSFLNYIKPKYAIICDSKKNPAEEETLAALKEVDATVFQTKDGDITVSSNGEEIEVTTN